MENKYTRHYAKLHVEHFTRIIRMALKIFVIQFEIHWF